MTNCACGTQIPDGRLALGYKTCVNCSTVQPYGCIPITNHKTGNTIQPVSKELSSAVAKSSRRRGYGTCLR